MMACFVSVWKQKDTFVVRILSEGHIGERTRKEAGRKRERELRKEREKKKKDRGYSKIKICV